MTRLLLIHTGGTIGMAQTKIGFAPQAGVVEAAVAGLTSSAGITVIALTPLIDSANATFAGWNRIADIIAAAHDSHDGFIVTHGTDTLAFSAAALCFALQGLRRPVILTGAMTPLGQPDSDGLRNLSDAVRAAQTASPGVGVQFAGQLLHGARLRKIHSQDHAAFADTATRQPPRHPGHRRQSMRPRRDPPWHLCRRKPAGANRSDRRQGHDTHGGLCQTGACAKLARRRPRQSAAPKPVRHG